MKVIGEGVQLADECPNCGHPFGQHVLELGCNRGWDGGRGDGCECPLTLAQQFGAPTEWDR